MLSFDSSGDCWVFNKRQPPKSSVFNQGHEGLPFFASQERCRKGGAFAPHPLHEGDLAKLAMVLSGKLHKRLGDAKGKAKGSFSMIGGSQSRCAQAKRGFSARRFTLHGERHSDCPAFEAPGAAECGGVQIVCLILLAATGLGELKT